MTFRVWKCPEINNPPGTFTHLWHLWSCSTMSNKQPISLNLPSLSRKNNQKTKTTETCSLCCTLSAWWSWGLGSEEPPWMAVCPLPCSLRDLHSRCFLRHKGRLTGAAFLVLILLIVATHSFLPPPSHRNSSHKRPQLWQGQSRRKQIQTLSQKFKQRCHHTLICIKPFTFTFTIHLLLSIYISIHRSFDWFIDEAIHPSICRQLSQKSHKSVINPLIYLFIQPSIQERRILKSRALQPESSIMSSSHPAIHNIYALSQPIIHPFIIYY